MREKKISKWENKMKPSNQSKYNKIPRLCVAIQRVGKVCNKLTASCLFLKILLGNGFNE